MNTYKVIAREDLSFAPHTWSEGLDYRVVERQDRFTLSSNEGQYYFTELLKDDILAYFQRVKEIRIPNSLINNFSSKEQAIRYLEEYGLVPNLVVMAWQDYPNNATVYIQKEEETPAETEAPSPEAALPAEELAIQSIIRHSEKKDKTIQELIHLNLWQARRIHGSHKRYAYEELEKITGENYEQYKKEGEPW